MIAEILLPFASMITSAFTAPSFISLTTPLIWFVALSLMLSSFETITLEALNKNIAFLPTLRSRAFSLSTVIVAFRTSPPASLPAINEFTAPVLTSDISTFS